MRPHFAGGAWRFTPPARLASCRLELRWSVEPLNFGMPAAKPSEPGPLAKAALAVRLKTIADEVCQFGVALTVFRQGRVSFNIDFSLAVGGFPA